MTERVCGACSLCCKLPYVPALDKPIDTWCSHARPGQGGCAIYPDRPAGCRTFICNWLAGKLGEEWFPARCKMIVTPSGTLAPSGTPAKPVMLIMVDPAYPNAWRREPYYSQLRARAGNILVVIRIGLRCIKLNADGSENEIVGTRAWIEGRAEEPAK